MKIQNHEHTYYKHYHHLILNLSTFVIFAIKDFKEYFFLHSSLKKKFKELKIHENQKNIILMINNGNLKKI